MNYYLKRLIVIFCLFCACFSSLNSEANVCSHVLRKMFGVQQSSRQVEPAMEESQAATLHPIGYFTSGYPFESIVAESPIDKYDWLIWDRTIKNGNTEFAIWEFFDKKGRKLGNSDVFSSFEEASIQTNLINVNFMTILKGLLNRGTKYSDIGSVRLVHTHPDATDGDTINYNFMFSKYDRKVASGYREYLDSQSALRHVFLEFQIVYNGENQLGNQLLKKAFILPPKI